MTDQFAYELPTLPTSGHGRLALERARPVYTVNEPACVPADQVVAAVTAPPVGPGDLDA